MKPPLEREGMNVIRVSSTDLGYGCLPEERTIDELLKKGLVILDKPRGPTSHQVVSWIKEILDLEKAGHHGTLDPNTTGVLPVALGDGVKLLETTLAGGKEYIAIMQMHSGMDDGKVRELLREFTGEIYQMVPVRSAVKRGLRTRRIDHMKLLDSQGPDKLLMIGCESGTYVRTLIHDMGEVLGVGANMSELRRSRSGSISEDRANTLHRLRDAWEIFRDNGDESELRKVVRPCEELVEHMPFMVLKDTAVDAVCHGAAVGVPGIVGVQNGIEKDRAVAIMTIKGELVGLGKAMMGTTEMLKARKGEAARPSRIIMEPGTYPRSWKSSDER